MRPVLFTMAPTLGASVMIIDMGLTPVFVEAEMAVETVEEAVEAVAEALPIVEMEVTPTKGPTIKAMATKTLIMWTTSLAKSRIRLVRIMQQGPTIMVPLHL